MNIQRGNGLWVWKPYIILDALEHVSDGDYVFYLDSGAFFFSSVKPLIDSMGECDVWISDIGFIEEQWTKPQVFELLGITDESIKTSGQVQATFVMFRKSDYSVKFVREWLGLCVRPELIKPLEPGEYRGECISHREDQSILSVLAKMNGIKPHKAAFIMPKPSSSITRMLKKVVKKLIGWKRPHNTGWPEAKVCRLEHDDKYSPCIYLHRIRWARSILSVVLQSIIGLGIVKTVNIVFRAATKRKDE